MDATAAPVTAWAESAAIPGDGVGPDAMRATRIVLAGADAPGRA